MFKTNYEKILTKKIKNSDLNDWRVDISDSDFFVNTKINLSLGRPYSLHLADTVNLKSDSEIMTNIDFSKEFCQFLSSYFKLLEENDNVKNSQNKCKIMLYLSKHFNHFGYMKIHVHSENHEEIEDHQKFVSENNLKLDTIRTRQFKEFENRNYVWYFFLDSESYTQFVLAFKNYRNKE